MSLQIFTIKKIPIKLHFTLIIVFFLISWTLATGFMPHYYPNLTTSQYWIMGIIGAIVLFVSILLHELSHSLLSIRYGIHVNQIILFIFGGISDIKDETKEFKKEFKIALVGPLTSYALSGLFWILFILVSFLNDNQQNIGNSLSSVEGILLYSSMVNLIIGSFNLIPAFPLDGGRMLRAALTKWKNDFDLSYWYSFENRDSNIIWNNRIRIYCYRKRIIFEWILVNNHWLVYQQRCSNIFRPE